MPSKKQIIKNRLTRQSQQNLTLLAIASGAVTLVGDPKTAEAFRQTLHCFPEYGNPRKNQKQVRAYIKDLRPVLDREDVRSDLAMAAVAQTILEDLSTYLNDPIKLLVMEGAIETIKDLSDAIDKDGDQYQVYEAVENVLENVYGMINFKGGRH